MDLLPFKAGIEAGRTPRAGEPQHRQLHGRPELPASLSPAVPNAREEWALTASPSPTIWRWTLVKAYARDGAVAVLALQAGNDMIVTTDYRTQIPRHRGGAGGHIWMRSVIDDACLRVPRDTFLGIPKTIPDWIFHENSLICYIF